MSIIFASYDTYPAFPFACQRDTKTEYANAPGKDYGFSSPGYSKLMPIVSSAAQCDLDAFKLMRHSTIQWKNVSTVIAVSKHCRALTTTVRVYILAHAYTYIRVYVLGI